MNSWSRTAIFVHVDLAVASNRARVGGLVRLLQRILFTNTQNAEEHREITNIARLWGRGGAGATDIGPKPRLEIPLRRAAPLDAPLLAPPAPPRFGGSLLG